MSHKSEAVSQKTLTAGRADPTAAAAAAAAWRDSHPPSRHHGTSSRRRRHRVIYERRRGVTAAHRWCHAVPRGEGGVSGRVSEVTVWGTARHADRPPPRTAEDRHGPPTGR